tara:strand:+ start:1498 stop:2193 length:696 start_codon:yes stop_codon:yes gene_type:complete
MGFLDQSTNNIILDAVLTDKGREALARNDGSFNIFKFAFGDDEVDYGHIKSFGRTVGKEKIEKNTPVLEASTHGNLGLKYRNISVNNDSITRLPSITLEGLTDAILSLTRTSSTDNFGSVVASQTLAGGGTLDPDLTDFSYKVTMDNLFLKYQTRPPISIDQDNVATYIVGSDSTIGPRGLSKLTFTVVAKAVSDATFDTYKQKGGSVVERIVTISGMNSGASINFRCQIT